MVSCSDYGFTAIDQHCPYVMTPNNLLVSQPQIKLFLDFLSAMAL